MLEEEDQSPTLSETTTPSYHSPGSILASYNSTIRSHLEENPMLVRGRYRNSGKKDYSGFFYDNLVDVSTGDMLTIRIPKGLRSKLNPDDACVVEGFLERRVKQEGYIDVTLVVTDVLIQEKMAADPVVLARQDILDKAQQRSRPNVEQDLRSLIAAGSQPSIAMVYGETGIVDRDVATALGTATTYYRLQEVRTNFTAPKQVALTLQTLDNQGYDHIALVRGGGSGLEVFDDLDLAITAVNLFTPLVVALGHEVDHPFLEKVACKCFSTPTTLGQWLKKVAEETHEDLARSKAALVKDVEKQFTDRIKGLEKQVEDTIKANGEQQKTIEGLQKQMEDARKSFDESRATSDEKSQEIIDGLKEQLEASKKTVEDQTKQNKELNERIEKLGQDFDLRQQEQSRQNGEALGALRKQLESSNVTSDQQAKTISALQAQAERLSDDAQNARKDADARYRAELSELRTINENQAVEIEHLKANTTKGLSPLWFVAALVIGLALGLLIAVTVL